MERLMAAQYAAEKLGSVVTWRELRLGMPAGVEYGAPGWEAERRIRIGQLKEADLVWREGRGAVIAEFAVWNPHQKVGQLLMYRRLLPETPGFRDLLGHQVEMRLVLGRPDPEAEAVARDVGIQVETYTPDWLRAEIAARMGDRYASDKRR